MGRKRIHIRSERLGISVFLMLCWYQLFHFLLALPREVCSQYAYRCMSEIEHVLSVGCMASIATMGIFAGMVGLYYWCQWVFIKCNGG